MEELRAMGVQKLNGIFREAGGRKMTNQMQVNVYPRYDGLISTPFLIFSEAHVVVLEPSILVRSHYGLVICNVLVWPVSNLNFIRKLFFPCVQVKIHPQTLVLVDVMIRLI